MAVTDGTIPTSGTVVIDFWAPWCAPCKQMETAVEEMDRAFDGRVTTVKVNIDDQCDIADEYAVSSIPTVAVVRDGAEVERHVGALTAIQLRAVYASAAGESSPGRRAGKRSPSFLIAVSAVVAAVIGLLFVIIR